MSKNPLTMIMETNKLNGSNYNDWLQNLRIVLNFENQGYVLDKPLPTALPEGSSPEERVMFEKWLKDNCKRFMRFLTGILDMPRQKHSLKPRWPRDSLYTVIGIKMLSLVEKLEYFKTRLNNDRYIYVILQSFPPFYNPFIINYNMNGLEKSINELINMLVQYEATTHKSVLAVLVREVSTSKAKAKRVGRWKRMKGMEKVIAAIASAEGAPAAPVGKGKGKGKVGGSQRSRANDIHMHCHGKGHWKRLCLQLLSNPGMFMIEVNMITNVISWVLDTGCGAHICNNLQVLERTKRLSRDEMILRLGDGKAVVAEAVGSLNLVISDYIRIE
ncbi:UNVERIFIED_CONTAM: hypothetical protein Slati_1437400 [Sesamum latifolium]|uniref:Retrotransposon Copia-like N-terminal domain-containing protein n=1 Tax=Sesamum latifolium TaxID=2727402 RepID=A0AAW2X431_9LAMI